MNQIYFGIVESRLDPLKLGRCRVRIIGLHTENKSELPTRDLPWATPILPITSASLSGIGDSPVGPVEGTCVAITFTDKECQFPIMIGTVPGIPSDINNFDVNVDDAETAFNPPNKDELPVNKEARNEKVADGDLYLGSMTKAQFEVFRNTVRQIESNGDYRSINKFGYIGAYQFGVQALEDLGFIRKGTWSTYRTNGNKVGDDGLGFNNPASWNGKNGVSSRIEFLGDKASQDRAFLLYAQMNYDRLRRNGVVNMDTPPEKLAGLLGIAHNQGLGAVYRHLEGNIGRDGFGTTTTSYYNKCFFAVAGNSTAELATFDNVKQPQIDRDIIAYTDGRKYDIIRSAFYKFFGGSVDSSGFRDPRGKYPLKDYLNEPDTNRLARAHKLGNTIVGIKDANRRKSIHIALSGATWSQPDIPYNAKYPFNHTYTSESGHVMEFDDTLGSERVNIHHKAGTFLEIDSNGSQTNRIVGHGCTIIEKDGIVLIEGSAHVHVAGDITIYAGNNLHVECTGDANVKAKNINARADQSANVVATNATIEGTAVATVKAPVLNLNGGAAVNIKAAVINLNGYINTNVGGGVEVPSIVSQVESDIKYTGSHNELPIINRSNEEDFTFENTEIAIANSELANAVAAPSIKSAVDEDSKIKPSTLPIVTGLCGFAPPVDIDTQLTTNFKIGNFCISNGFPFNGQHGLSGEELACNLKQLALNVAEPIFGQFNEFRPKITSGIRTARAGSTSQHEKGQALDIVFMTNYGSSNSARELHYEMAKKIRDLVQFDQLILEYTTNGAVWIHVSFSLTSKRRQVFTMNNHKVYGSGLILLKSDA